MESAEGRKAAEEGLAKAFATGAESDLTLVCGEHKFPVHSILFRFRSDQIKTQLDGDFQEGKSRTIVVGAPSATRGSVRRLIHYIYFHTYDDASSFDEWEDFQRAVGYEDDSDEQNIKEHYGNERELGEDESAQNTHADNKRASKQLDPEAVEAMLNLVNNLHVYALSDYYMIKDLQKFAKGKYERALTADALPCLAAVVHELTEHVGIEDPLYEMTVTFAAENRDKIGNNATLLAVLSKDSEFMSNMFQASTSAYENEIAQLANDWTTKMSALEEKLAASEKKAADGDAATKKLAETEEKLASAMEGHNELSELKRHKEQADGVIDNIFNTISKCRHCPRGIDVFVKKWTVADWQVKCCKCNKDMSWK